MGRRIYLIVPALLILVLAGQTLPGLVQARKVKQSCRGYGEVLSAREVARLAYNAHFRCGDLVAAIAIAGVESEGYNPNLQCRNLRPDGSERNSDWGLWQINDDPRNFGNDCPPACALNPVQAASQTYSMFHQENHNDWRYWQASYNTVAYKTRIPEAQSAAAPYNRGCRDCPRGICQPTPSPFESD